MRRSTLTLVLSLTAVFVSGALVGGFGYRMCTSTTASASQTPVEGVNREQAQRRPSPEEFRAMYINAMTKRLDLTGDQIQELHLILDRTDQRFKDLDAKTRPEKQQIQKLQHQEIKAILSPDQQTAYATFLEERAARRRAREEEKKSKETH